MKNWLLSILKTIKEIKHYSWSGDMPPNLEVR